LIHELAVVAVEAPAAAEATVNWSSVVSAILTYIIDWTKIDGEVGFDDFFGLFSFKALSKVRERLSWPQW